MYFTLSMHTFISELDESKAETRVGITTNTTINNLSIKRENQCQKYSQLYQNDQGRYLLQEETQTLIPVHNH